ncbi:RHS repeat domain-containing protein [Pseudodesulfovibrio sp.]|uniref:RHS repeat domain-containing protein n=1 Tax=unclassified Pseudodesulfovibrio TaxID=2661612 RepID=UPI003AFFCB85
MKAPYSCELRRGPDGRIREKTETVAGKPTTWTYAYDKAGRLTEAKRDGRTVCAVEYDREGRRARDYFPHLDTSYRNFTYAPDNRLQRAGNNAFTHDKNGFRSIWNHGGTYTLYEYGPDYRLLKAEKRETGEVFEFTHDDQGRRSVKYCNGKPVAAYRWLDLLRLDGFHNGASGYRFAYRSDERTPYAMQREDGAGFHLFYDQVGSLRVVADAHGNVIKEVLYDPFGSIIADSNPALRIPIGFAGGLHDQDLGFVRFGWRDYDTFTDRWTAPDPLGDAGGDPDWYGYCLDDPVNGVDPLGLEGFWGGVKKIGAGLGQLWDKAPAGIGKAITRGTKGAGEAISKTADAFATNKDLQKYSAIALGAGALPIVAAAGATAGPAIVGAAMQHPAELAAASEMVSDFASGAFDPGPPPISWSGVAGMTAKAGYDYIKNQRRKRK